jgi:hypothetical protein
LTDTYCLERFNQLAGDRFALGGFRHTCILQH